MTIDLLAIGDVTVDAFIRLKDARAYCNIKDESCELCVRYGDKIPYEFADILPGVGNAGNAATAASRLGLSSALRTFVGDDADGAACIAEFEKNGIDTSLVVREKDVKTNYHYVLWYDVERTILIKHEAYHYSLPQDIEEPKWVYLTSMPEESRGYHDEIARYLKEHPEVRLAFQPGTFQLKLGAEALKDIYARTDVFFCNKQEAQIVLKTGSLDTRELLEGIRALGVKTVFITDGRNGSSLLDDEGMWHAPMFPDPKPPVERTGAGDATASTTVAYIIKGLSPREALLRGLVNAAYVVQEVGAQRGLLSAERLEEYYAGRPADFTTEPIS